LCRLRLAENAAFLEIKYVTEGPRRPAAIGLLADRRWQLLTEAALVEMSSPASETTDRQLLRLPFPTDIDERSAATLEFRLKRPLTPGTLRLPQIEPTSLPIAGRWLAVTDEAGWEYEITSPGASAKPIDEFLSAWSGAITPPAEIKPSGRGEAVQPAAFTERPGHTHWQIAVRPKRIESSMEELVQIVAGNRRLQMHYRADVTPGLDHQFRLPLGASEDLVVDQIELTSGGASRPCRWVRSAADEIQVFFGERLTGAYRLTLIGSAPADSRAPLPLPSVRFPARNGSSLRIELYHDEDVAIEPSGLIEQTSVGESPGEPLPAGWSGRLAGTYVVPGDALKSARLTIVPGPRAQARELPRAIQSTNSPLSTATPTDAQDRTLPASVRLADTTVLFGTAGETVTATRLVLASSDLTECELELPAGEQLVKFDLGAKPAPVRRLDNGRWTIPLGPLRLPQLLEIVTRSSSSAGGALARPRLFAHGSPLPVEVGLWTVGRPVAARDPAVRGATAVAIADHAALRIDRSISIVEAATPAASAMDLPATRGWFGDWAEHLSGLRQQAINSGGLPAMNGSSTQVPLAAADQLSDAARRIDAWLQQSKAQRPAAEQHNEPPEGRLAPVNERMIEWSWYVADGFADRLTIETVNGERANVVNRTFGLLAILGVAAISVWMVRQPAIGEMFWLWPEALGVVGGVGYASWLRPGWLGWLIVSASLTLAVQRTFAHRAAKRVT
jgi:hypothetical protein